MNQYNPDDYPHPGSVLLTELEDIGFSQNGFARYIGVEPSVIEGLCSEQAELTAILALRIARALGTSPRKWLELQMNYSLVHTPKEEYDHIKPLGS